MKKISKSNLAQLWETVSKDFKLFLPVEKDGKVNFSLWQDDANVDLEAVNTNVSPKNYIFPQSETYLKFKVEGKKLSLENVGVNKEEYVLFGVRPCDAVAFNLIDNVFLREPVDRLYEARRNAGIIISMACSAPEETCFCGSFDIKPETAPEGVDVFTWDIGDAILWQGQSAKGEIFTEKFIEFFQDAVEADLKEVEDLKNSIKEQVNNLPLSHIDPKKIDRDLKDIFDSKVWEEASKSCLGCGSCTYVCPTCHCYDIQDYDGGKDGERFRCWDSCMFSDFTRMAHGNPRTSQKERFRQRFMHKLVYYPNNHQEYACVGCGRCIEKCPVNMNIAKIIKKIGGEK